MEHIPTKIKHPPLFQIEDTLLPAFEINGRLIKTFNKLPRLWDDYAAQVLPFINQAQITKAEMSTILLNLSLRPEAFLEWNEEYFDEQFAETVKIATERGSHGA